MILFSANPSILLPISKARQKYRSLLTENAATNRLSSKKVVKNRRFGRGSPQTRAHQKLWIGRFDDFRRITLRKDLQQPYTGDDLIRFFEIILREST